MCLSSKAPQAAPPAAPPPAPKPVEFGGVESQASAKKKKTSARSSLSIPLTVGGTAGNTGLGIPT